MQGKWALHRNQGVHILILGSCLALNLNYCGCCKLSLSSQCYNDGCYCDENCHKGCSDIDNIGYYSNW